MEWSRIEALVNKYWEGETTVAEERELKQFFHSHQAKDLPEPLREVASLFQYYVAEENKQPLGAAFDQQLLDQLRARPFTNAEGQRSWYLNLLKLAACLFLVVSAVLVFRNEQRKARAQQRLAELGTYEDPQQAYEATKKALLLVSAQLNKGKTYTVEITRISEAEEVVKRDLTQATKN